MSQEPQAEAGAKPKSKGKLPLLIAAGAVLVLGGGGAGYFFLSGQGSASGTAHAAEADAHADAGAHGESAAPAGGDHGGGGDHGDGHGGGGSSSVYELPTMTVNLSTSGETAAFLKLTVALELKSADMVGAVEPRLARVIDAFQVYLRELRRSDLEGSAGVYRLKEELRRRVNIAIYPAEVDSVLFKEIIVQ